MRRHWDPGLFDPAPCAHLPGHDLRKLTASAHLRVDNERPVLLCVCVFFEHVFMGLCSIEYVDAAHQKLAQESNVPCPVHCSEYVVLSPVVMPPVASTLFILAGGLRICVVSRARSCSWLHICVRSRASGQNSSCYRGLRPGWLSNSTSFVDVPDETVTAPAVCQECTTTFLAKTAPPANGRVDAQLLNLNCNGSRIGSEFCGGRGVRVGSKTSMVAVCAIHCRRVM